MAVMVINSGVPSRKLINVVAPMILLGSGVAAGASFGALLGGIAAAFDSAVVGVLVTGGSIAIAAGVLASNRPWQLDIETPSAWLEYHDWRTAAFNGATLGLGFASRIGYWAWYLLPIGVLAIRDPMIGAAIFGTYAIVRLALSAFVTARLPAGCLSSWRNQATRVLDPLTLFFLSFVIAAAWLTRSSI